MRTGISITVMASDRKRLQALVKNRNAAQKHAWRAEIVLPSADGAPRPRSGASRRTSGDQASALFALRALDGAACALSQTEETGTRPMGPGDLTGDNCE
jgi:hypothetical protein